MPLNGFDSRPTRTYTGSFNVLRRVQFPNRFEGGKADKDLLKKLTTPEKLSGILNWALEGLRRLQSNHCDFSNSRSTEEVRQDYIRRSSPIKAFLMDCTFNRPDGKVPKKVLFEAFVKYCTKAKLAPVTDQTFYRNLPLYFSKNPLQESKLTVDVDGKEKRLSCYIGIALRPEDEWGKPSTQDQEEGLKELDVG